MNNDTTKCILAIHDIFGWESGRHRAHCDTMAEAGYKVIMVDNFEGNPWPKDKKYDHEEE